MKRISSILFNEFCLPWFSVATVSLSGFITTFFVFNYFVENDKEMLAKRVLDGGENILSSLELRKYNDPALTLFSTTFLDISSTIQSPDDISNELLEEYLHEDYADYDVLPADLSLRYYKKIPFQSSISKFELDEANAPDPVIFEFEQLEFYPKNGIANEYRNNSYTVLFHAELEAGHYTTIDFYGDPSFQSAMDVARDTGKLTYRISIPYIEDISSLRGHFSIQFEHYFFPIYRNLLPSDDIDTRREKLDGYLSFMFSTWSEGNHEIYNSTTGIVTTFLPQSENLFSDYLSKNIKKAIEAGNIHTLNYSKESQIDLIQDEYLVLARPSEDLEKLMISSNRWWALALGLFMTIWVSSLVAWSQTKTRRVMALVDKRTRELKEKTRTLQVAHTALNHSEKLYRMLADNINDVIFTHDMDGVCTYISPSVLSQTGYPPKEYLKKPIEHYFATEQKDLIAQGIRETIQTVQESSKKDISTHPFIFQSTCKDGTQKWFETEITTMNNQAGETEGFLGISRDVTARINAEQEKEKLESEFRQAQKMEAIGNLAGGVAHDFNNLLTGILGHADMMKLQRPISPENKRSLNVIETAALRARELTSQLLGFARKGKYTLVLVDLNQIVQDIISLMERTVDKRIVINLETSAPTPYIMGDTGQISQVILNMAVNSRDAMPEGGTLLFRTNVITLNDEIPIKHDDLKPGPYSHISISDTGHGIPSDIIDKIFDPFFTNKENGKGTGMGLAMAYGVIRNHGGFIEVESTPGEGTTFDIYLPYKTSDEEEDSAEPQNLATGSGKVLFVDDEDIIRELATTMLNRLGYDVLTAENGAEGIVVYKKHWKEISFVIVDIIMPEVDGIDCLRELRRFNPDLKAILTTGYSRESVADKLNENLAQEFLEKPFRLKTLATAITSLLEETSDAAE